MVRLNELDFVAEDLGRAQKHGVAHLRVDLRGGLHLHAVKVDAILALLGAVPAEGLVNDLDRARVWRHVVVAKSAAGDAERVPARLCEHLGNDGRAHIGAREATVILGQAPRKRRRDGERAAVPRTRVVDDREPVQVPHVRRLRYRLDGALARVQH